MTDADRLLIEKYIIACKNKYICVMCNEKLDEKKIQFISSSPRMGDLMVYFLCTNHMHTYLSEALLLSLAKERVNLC